MQAVIAANSALSIVHRSRPTAATREVLIQIGAAGVNRADILQRLGKYPPPAGATDVLGLECAGRIVEIGANVQRKFKIGDRVMALVTGGCYAEFVAANEACVLSIPEKMSFRQAAAVPEVWTTAWQLLKFVTHTQKHDRVLVHAAASSVGLAVTQIAARGIGATVLATSSTEEKLKLCREMGATILINYKTHPEFSTEVTRHGGEVNVILDCVGASHWKQNLRSIAMDGRWALYGTLGGTNVADVNLGVLLRKHVTLIATTLRNRSLEYQGELLSDLEKNVLPELANERYQLLVDRTFKLDDVEQAHAYVESNSNIGKVVLIVDPQL